MSETDIVFLHFSFFPYFFILLRLERMGIIGKIGIGLRIPQFGILVSLALHGPVHSNHHISSRDAGFFDTNFQDRMPAGSIPRIQRKPNHRTTKILSPVDHCIAATGKPAIIAKQKIDMNPSIF